MEVHWAYQRYILILIHTCKQEYIDTCKYNNIIWSGISTNLSRKLGCKTAFTCLYIMSWIMEGFNHIAKFWTLNDGMIYRRSVKAEGFAMFHWYSQTFLRSGSGFGNNQRLESKSQIGHRLGGGVIGRRAWWWQVTLRGRLIGHRGKAHGRLQKGSLTKTSFGECSGTSWDSTLLVMILYWRVLPISVIQQSNLPLGNLFRVTCFLRALWIMWLEFLFLTLDATLDMPAC